MLENIEFYVLPDGSVNIKKQGEPVAPYLLECEDITNEMIILIRDLYPEAYSKLSEIYSKSEKNHKFFEYRMVNRFIRCNFGECDTLSHDIDEIGQFNFEEVRCPMRGECPYEGTICKPKLQTRLTKREQEVAELLAAGLHKIKVAERLNISVYTVNRHIQKIKVRMHLSHTYQIISQFNGAK